MPYPHDDLEPKTRLARAIKYALTRGRKPDELIGDPSDPYMRRWRVRNTGGRHTWGLYLHHIRLSDDDRALHDHRYASVSLILEGGYIEHTPGPGFKTVHSYDPPRFEYDNRATVRHLFGAGSLIKRPHAAAPHRLELVNGEPAWTLFVIGTPVRDWGFYCGRGWVPWREFVSTHEHGNMRGKGCD